MEKTPIRIFIVEPHEEISHALSQFIQSQADLKLVGIASNSAKALRLIPYAEPHIILGNISEISENQYEFIQQIMGQAAVPIIVMCNKDDRDNIEKGLLAMSQGALAAISYSHYQKDYTRLVFQNELREYINTLSEVKLVTRYNRNRPIEKMFTEQERKEKKFECVAIGASLGGPQALSTIISQFPSDFPVPIFIVQHISLGFGKGLVDWLSENSKMPIEVAEDGVKALPGHIYVAPDNAHLKIEKGGYLKIIKRTKENELCPAIAHLFNSVALTYGPQAIGVILTGMGKDGAEDLLFMKKKGAYTIAQDEISSLMFSMPKAAIEMGGAKEVLPLDQIAERIITLINKDYKS